ncbi:MAG: hypothetical protein AABX59_03860 [Nanoarchaeota archaeon]
MNLNSKFEIKRQIVHILLGLVIILLALYDRTFALWLIFSFLMLGIILALISLKLDVPIISWFLKNFERDEYREKFPFKGAIFFFAGSLLTLKLFSFDIALASISILTFGDSFSHLVGIYGKYKSKLDLKRRKNLEGMVVGIVVGAIVASFFVNIISALAASALAMIAENISVKLQGEEVDDNIIIPVVAGTVLHILKNYI